MCGQGAGAPVDAAPRHPGQGQAQVRGDHRQRTPLASGPGPGAAPLHTGSAQRGVERRHHLHRHRGMAVSGGRTGAAQPPGGGLEPAGAHADLTGQGRAADGLLSTPAGRGSDLSQRQGQPVFQPRLPGHFDGVGHAQLDVTQGQLLGQRAHREPVGTAEDGLRSWPAVCHARAGKADDYGLDRFLQPHAATFGAGLPQPDAVRTTLVGGAAQICRLKIGLRTPVFRGNLKSALGSKTPMQAMKHWHQERPDYSTSGPMTVRDATPNATLGNYDSPSAPTLKSEGIQR